MDFVSISGGSRIFLRGTSLVICQWTVTTIFVSNEWRQQLVVRIFFGTAFALRSRGEGS